MRSPREVLVALALAGGAVACEPGGADPATGALETHAFHGITYAAPVGTSSANSGVDRPSHYPDPATGQVIEIATRIEPAVTLIFPDTNRYVVEIKKPPERVSLADMVAGMSRRPEVSRVAGKPEIGGWSLRYEWTSDGQAPVTIVHRRYALPDSDYECTYDTGNTRDVAAAERICGSLRPKDTTAR